LCPEGCPTDEDMSTLGRIEESRSPAIDCLCVVDGPMDPSVLCSASEGRLLKRRDSRPITGVDNGMCSAPAVRIMWEGRRTARH
jgi:hypothetical protein